ncbi:hypothetical protein DMB66_52915 [Actinoplanes sp. ATCC 53533]|nr:hypothetical protein DMB66_52915 [Actinoplanes sp. ATCC 53533]
MECLMPRHLCQTGSALFKGAHIVPTHGADQHLHSLTDLRAKDTGDLHLSVQALSQERWQLFPVWNAEEPPPL